MLKTGEIIQAEIVDLGINGEGVAKHGGIPIFVPFALPGEKVDIKIVHVKKDLAFGELASVSAASAERIPPRCPHFTICGGCDVQHMSENLQAAFKRDSLANTLRKSLKDIPFFVDETVCGERRFAYRNKLQLPFGFKNGKAVLGFFEKQSHKVVPIKSCPLHDDWADKLIAILCNWANGGATSTTARAGNSSSSLSNSKKPAPAPPVSVYNEKTGKGLLRHAVARMLDTLTLTLVINGNALPRQEELTAELGRAFPGFKLYVSKNTKNTNVILGDSVKLVTGGGQPDSIAGIKAELSPLSFLQVNNEISSLIYHRTLDAVKGSDIIIDAYSGVGILTSMLAAGLKNKSAEKLQAILPCVYGIEIVKDAVNDADRIAKENGLSEYIENLCGDTSEVLPNLMLKLSNLHNKHSDLHFSVILDPPRKGCDTGTLDAILEARPKTVVYISCNPATLARDLKTLTSGGVYQIKSVTPYDMFPQTKHVETLCILELK